MRRTASSSSFLRRATVTASAVAMAFAAFGSTQALARGPAGATPDANFINTYQAWNGSDYVYPFGCPNTTTYGQVITIPEGTTLLNRYTFWWEYNSGSGSMVVRGEVYAWNGSMATGPNLWQSRRRTISFTDAVYHRERFSPNGITVTPGAQYVIFASIDKDYEQCTGSYEVKWGAIYADVYNGGDFVFQNNGGDESQWTTTAWNILPYDAAMRVGGS